MFPVICQIGPIKLYSYGLMLAIAAVVCSYLLSRDAHKKGIKNELIYDLMMWIVISGILGARLFYIFLNLSFFLENPLEIIMIHHGGLAFQGGFIAAVVTGIWFVKEHKLPLLMMLDLTAPYIALGHAIGRIGCFLNGCCYGKPVSWGIYFPIYNEHLHSTQLYEAAGLLIIFFVLKAMQKSNRNSGQIFVTYLILSSMLRFANEFFRADHVEAYLGLSIYQIVSIGIFLAGLILSLKLRKSQGRNF